MWHLIIVCTKKYNLNYYIQIDLPSIVVNPDSLSQLILILNCVLQNNILTSYLICTFIHIHIYIHRSIPYNRYRMICLSRTHVAHSPLC